MHYQKKTGNSAWSTLRNTFLNSGSDDLADLAKYQCEIARLHSLFAWSSLYFAVVTFKNRLHLSDEIFD